MTYFMVASASCDDDSVTSLIQKMTGCYYSCKYVVSNSCYLGVKLYLNLFLA